MPVMTCMFTKNFTISTLVTRPVAAHPIQITTKQRVVQMSASARGGHAHGHVHGRDTRTVAVEVHDVEQGVDLLL